MKQPNNKPSKTPKTVQQSNTEISSSSSDVSPVRKKVMKENNEIKSLTAPLIEIVESLEYEVSPIDGTLNLIDGSTTNFPGMFLFI